MPTGPTPTARQREAVEAYLELVEAEPSLFAGRRRRPLVLDRDSLLEFAAANDVVVGVLASTPYLWLLNDVVVTPQPDGSPLAHTYLREIAPPGHTGVPGVVVLATLRDGNGSTQVVMVEQERHATATVELELPRGFGEPGRDSCAQAARELLEETGFMADVITPLGTTVTNSGAGDGLVDYFHVQVARRTAASPEAGEVGITCRLVGWDDLWAQVGTGGVRDGFTAQALCLFEARHRGRALS